MSWHCGTPFSLSSFEDIYVTGTAFYHAGRIHLLLYTPHICQNCQLLYTVVGQFVFLFGVLFVVAVQACKFIIFFLYLVLHSYRLVADMTGFCTFMTGITNLCFASFCINCSPFATTSHVWPFSSFLQTWE